MNAFFFCYLLRVFFASFTISLFTGKKRKIPIRPVSNPFDPMHKTPGLLPFSSFPFSFNPHSPFFFFFSFRHLGPTFKSSSEFSSLSFTSLNNLSWVFIHSVKKSSTPFAHSSFAAFFPFISFTEPIGPKVGSGPGGVEVGK